MRQLAGRALAKEPGRRVPLRAERAEEEDRLRQPRPLAHQIDRGRVGPVKVIQLKDERRLSRAPLDQSPDGAEEQALQALRREGGEP
jgi:hypothetical protein